MKLHENLKTRFGEPGPGRTAASIKPHWGFWGLGMFSFFQWRCRWDQHKNHENMQGNGNLPRDLERIFKRKQTCRNNFLSCSWTCNHVIHAETIFEGQGPFLLLGLMISRTGETNPGVKI